MKNELLTEESTRSEKIRVKSKPEKCPVSTILYGNIGYSPQLSEQMEKREVVLGGCSIYPDKPRWQCSKCGTKFYKESQD